MVFLSFGFPIMETPFAYRTLSIPESLKAIKDNLGILKNIKVCKMKNIGTQEATPLQVLCRRVEFLHPVFSLHRCFGVCLGFRVYVLISQENLYIIFLILQESYNFVLHFSSFRRLFKNFFMSEQQTFQNIGC